MHLAPTAFLSDAWGGEWGNGGMVEQSLDVLTRTRGRLGPIRNPIISFTLAAVVIVVVVVVVGVASPLLLLCQADAISWSGGEPPLSLSSPDNLSVFNLFPLFQNGSKNIHIVEGKGRRWVLVGYMNKEERKKKTRGWDSSVWEGERTGRPFPSSLTPCVIRGVSWCERVAKRHGERKRKKRGASLATHVSPIAQTTTTCRDHQRGAGKCSSSC